MKRAKRTKEERLQSRKNKLRRMFGRRFRAGSYSAFAAVVVVAIAIVINMAVSALPSSMTQIDMTSNSIYSLSAQTKAIVQSVDKDVNLYILATQGNEDATVVRLLERYSDLNNHLKVATVDPTAQPTFLDSYDLSAYQLYANSVLVDCDGRYRLVNYTDIFVTDYDMDYNTYQYTTTNSFNGENELTNAIHYVTSDNLPKIYTLTGHGETDLSESIVAMIEQDNMETEALSLFSYEAMPEDAGVLVINAPSSDLSDKEAELLSTWLESGGRILLITANFSTEDMPNLLKVASSMGITAQDGLIIEGDNRMHLNGYPAYLLPDLESHEITDALIDSHYYVLMSMAQPLTETGSGNATVTFLMTTSTSAFAKPEGLEAKSVKKSDGDTNGPFHVAAASEKGDGKLCWFASSELLEAQLDRMVSGANSNLFMNALNWMCDQQESISIRAKSLDSTGLTVTGAQSSFWSTAMIGLIPIAFVAAGIMIYVRRKRR